KLTLLLLTCDYHTTFMFAIMMISITTNHVHADYEIAMFLLVPPSHSNIKIHIPVHKIPDDALLAPIRHFDFLSPLLHPEYDHHYKRTEMQNLALGLMIIRFF